MRSTIKAQCVARAKFDFAKPAPRPAETASRARSRLLSRGVANLLLATLAFAVMNVFVKQLDRIPAMEIVM